MPGDIEEIDEAEQPQVDFTFHHLPNPGFHSFYSKNCSSLFGKWGFGEDMVALKFRYEQNIREEDIPNAIEAFFKDDTVRGVLHSTTKLRVLDPKKVKLYMERVPTQALNMSFLNKFEECGAISHTGHIRGRIEEDFEELPISDLVRECIVMEESELYTAFSDQERKEFLFRIFSHMAFGGASNQYEDHVEEYFKATKAIYKDLLSVRKNDAGDVEVVSWVYKIASIGHGGSLFPKNHPTNFCYLSLDRTMRHISFWWFGYKPIW